MTTSKPQPVKIGNRLIGDDHPPYVIAEVSSNHLGKIELAKDLIRVAHEAGADAVKLQTARPEIITLDCDKDDFVVQDGLWAGRKLFDLYKEVNTPWEWHEELFAFGRELGIEIFSSPFDVGAVDLLETLNPAAYKIASFEAVDIQLIEKVAVTGRPIIISTGMTAPEDIENALQAAQGASGVILLHCISGYPTPPEEANLKTIQHLADKYGVIVGLSDHTLSNSVSVAGVALGAKVIEKHIILDRNAGGADAPFSIEPDELSALVRDVKDAWNAIGEIKQGLSNSEASSAPFRRSLYVVEDMKPGEKISEANVRSIRPGYGLAPKHLPEVLGRTVNQAVERGTPLSWALIDG